MAGHSQFKNIMYRKGAQDAKKARLFAKLARELFVAAKLGPDPHSNPRLRTALSAARLINMPKDNIDRAIKKASGEGGAETYEEVRYEGYGPGGIPIIIETLTDNRNRTASEVRSTLTRYGGNLGETGSVGFLFDRIGYLRFPTDNLDKVFELSAEAGADDVNLIEGACEITCPIEAFSHVRECLTTHFGEPEASSIVWRSLNPIDCSEEVKKTLSKLVDALEDSDDVQSVHVGILWEN